MLMTSGPLVVVVSQSLPVASIAELVKLAQAKPGALTYASIGNGTTQHITVELFKRLTHTDLKHVPYKETSSAIGDLLSGRIDIMFESQPAIEQHIASGRLRALAVTEKRRSLGLPGVPTLNEAGVRDYEFSGWNGVVVPTGTPAHVVTKLHDAFVQVLSMRETERNFALTGSRPGSGTAAEFAEHIRSERDKWGAMIKSENIGIE
jgi:tripartite-type tricarboxylate transporter receptor subunit TctC